MQKISIFFLLIFSSLQSFCQSGNASKSPEEYVRKSRVQKTIGWAFIAGGTAIAATGAIIQVNDIEKFLMMKRITLLLFIKVLVYF